MYNIFHDVLGRATVFLTFLAAMVIVAKSLLFLVRGARVGGLLRRKLRVEPARIKVLGFSAMTTVLSINAAWRNDPAMRPAYAFAITSGAVVGVFFVLVMDYVLEARKNSANKK